MTAVIFACIFTMYSLNDLGIVTLFTRIALPHIVHSMRFTSQFVTGMLCVYTVVSLADCLHVIFACYFSILDR